VGAREHVLQHVKLYVSAQVKDDPLMTIRQYANALSGVLGVAVNKEYANRVAVALY
jgi:hypothetical protein